MTLDPPLLTEQDLREELEEIHARRHASIHTALFGRSEVRAVEVATCRGTVTYGVRQARCELELRKWLAGDADQPLVLLADFGTDIPIDVAGRLAPRGIHIVSGDRRLARAFGGVSVNPSVPGVLRRALLGEPPSSHPQLRGTTLDVETAWRALLHSRFGYPFDWPVNEERLVSFCAVDRARAPGQLSDGDLAAALRSFIDGRAGRLGALALDAWQHGKGRDIATLAFVLEVAAADLGGNGYLRARVAGLLERIDPALGTWVTDARDLLSRWGALAPRIALRLGRELDGILEEAESLVPDAELEPVVARSRYLPRGFDLVKRSLAHGLARTVEEPTRSNFEEAKILFTTLTQHRLHESRSNQQLVERARMALRILGYRLSRPDIKDLARSGPAYEEMVLLAEHQAREGCYLDAARRAARGGGGADILGEVVDRIVAWADGLRDDDDERFARGLRAWIDGGRKADRVVPIDAALDRLAAAFLAGGEHRKLLVVLMDGMAWGNAVELLLDLEAHHFGPVGWRPRGADPKSLLPPVIAALPSRTNISRSALFAGALMEPGKPTLTGRDPERFAANKSMAPFGPATLLLADDLATPSGEASRKALDLVASEMRVVGVVINAIDEQLKGSRQIRVRYDVATIKPLRGLLDAATSAGRAILLLSDHGHVPGARLRYLGRRSGEGHARSRSLAEDEAPAAYEIELTGHGVYHERAKPRVALLYRECDTYSPSVAEGEHGGASMAEVVAPAVLVAGEQLMDSLRNEGEWDPELALVPLPRPRWWDLELRPQGRTVAPPQKGPAKAAGRKTERASPQPLIPFEPIPAPVQGSPRTPGEILRSGALARGLQPAKKRQLDQEVAPRLDVLAAHDGRMAADLFAREVGIPPFRVAGAVAQISEWLNLDGYPVISFDATSRLIVLQLELFRELFEEPCPGGNGA